MVWMMSSSSCAGMAGIALRHRDGFADPPRDQRDVHHIGVHGGNGEQTDEPVLDRLMPGMLADDDDVGVGAVAQEAGNRGLREHQQIVAVGELRQDVVAEPKDAETAGHVDRRLTALHRAALIAEQHEMPVGEPAQQRRDVFTVGAGEPALGVGVEFVGQTEQRSRQRARVERDLAGVGEHPRQQPPDLVDGLGIDGAGQLDVNPRLVDGFVAVVGLGGGLDVAQLAGRVRGAPGEPGS